jgi:hypothetical protein
MQIPEERIISAKIK